MGIEEMRKQLQALGYATTDYPNGFLSFMYKIPHGKFRDQVVEIALQPPGTFPEVPPSGPYIKPHLLPINGDSGEHPYGRIHQRNQPTPDFQYWSRPCNEWAETEQNMRGYLAFLRTLFDFE